jgi:glutathione-specific gamma-glutamylcyclotransferase
MAHMADASFRLTREAVLEGSIRSLITAIDPQIRLLDAAELRASADAFLASRPGSGDIWLFAYGSLIWNPRIHYVERRIGLVRGYHRSFCLWTRIGRGTAEKPGLTLGLERGGACRGVVYRIAEAVAAQELEIVWRREMVTGAYTPRWITTSTAEGPVPALAFLVNRGHVRYAGRLSEDRVVATIAEAHGPLGTCAAYLFNTAAHLEELGIRDRPLLRLRDRMAAAIERASMPTS